MVAIIFWPTVTLLMKKLYIIKASYTITIGMIKSTKIILVHPKCDISFGAIKLPI